MSQYLTRRPGFAERHVSFLVAQATHGDSTTRDRPPPPSTRCEQGRACELIKDAPPAISFRYGVRSLFMSDPLSYLPLALAGADGTLNGVPVRRLVAAGHNVLVNGATGGIGSAAVQFLRHAGVRVTATANT